MGSLKTMPPIEIDNQELREWGEKWLLNEFVDQNGDTKSKNKESFHKYQSVNFCAFIDSSFGNSIAKMLGDIPICTPNSNSLLPVESNCVEVGSTRVIGGIRPQNYDVAYRPDGARIVFDSKSLNDKKSIGKNWQNMINDLGTEATTVHTRFPYALTIFFVVLPSTALMLKQENDITRTLERMGTRKNVIDPPHLAESISLIVWDPETGSIDSERPMKTSNLRLEKAHQRIEEIYLERYKGLPPHD